MDSIPLIILAGIGLGYLVGVIVGLLIGLDIGRQRERRSMADRCRHLSDWAVKARRTGFIPSIVRRA